MGKAGKIPVIPLNRNTSLRRHSTASATITSEDQVSLGDDHDYLSRAAGAASFLQDQYSNSAACKQVPRTTLDSAKDTNVGQSSCSPSAVGLVEQRSANSSVARNKFLNNDNGNINDPVPSTSTDNQEQTTHSLLQVWQYFHFIPRDVCDFIGRRRVFELGPIVKTRIKALEGKLSKSGILLFGNVHENLDS